MTEQIYYSNWGDKLKPGHESYWDDISSLSSMIGNDLISPYQMNYFLKEGEDYLRQSSSIAVIQTKEKFGQVRVYCRLGCNSIISKKYSKHVMDIADQNKKWSNFLMFGEKPKEYSSFWERRMREKYPISPEDKDEFFLKKYKSDIFTYRNVYMRYFRMLPHYRDAMFYGADYPEYLLENGEVAKKYIADKKRKLEEDKIEYDWSDEIYKSRLEIINNQEKEFSLIYNIE